MARGKISVDTEITHDTVMKEDIFVHSNVNFVFYFLAVRECLASKLNSKSINKADPPTQPLYRAIFNRLKLQ